MKEIPFDDFAGAVLKLAKDNIDETLRLPGVWEIISEHFSNEAIDCCIESQRNKRRAQIGDILTTLHHNGFC